VKASAEIVESLVDGRVLVIGSLPPDGRDLDLLVRPVELEALTSGLRAHGFRQKGKQFARFRGCTVDSIDLHPAEKWGLGGREAEALFAEARPLEGMGHVVRPAPHHALLILARRFVLWQGGRLDEKRKARARAAVEESPQAWAVASERVAHWRAREALAGLEAAYREGVPMSRSHHARAVSELTSGVGGDGRGRVWNRPRLRTLLREAPRRLVSISGLDGAGKSTQAAALVRSLDRLGIEATTVWTRLEWTTLWENRSLEAIARPAKATLGLIHQGKRGGDTNMSRAARDRPTSRSVDPGRSIRQGSAIVTHLWVTIVALFHAAAQRRAVQPHLARGKLVVCDRYTLDAAAHLRHRYGPERRFRFQVWLIDFLSPRPLCSFFLDVAPETAYGRKKELTPGDLTRLAKLYRAECSTLRARQLDGESTPEHLCAEIASDVWRRV
jgi:thymidylate kinase